MTDQQRQEIVLDFVEFAKNKLDIKQLPKISFVNKRDWAVKRHSFGQYNNQEKALQVYIGNRNLADVLRTLGHELVHHRQNELGMIKPGSGDTGSEIENQANSLAGVMMRDYGRINDLIYETVIPSLKEIYEAEKSGRIQIYCDMDGVLCDFDSRFEHYYGVPPREYAKEKGQKAMEEAVDKVGIVYWSKMPWLKGGRELWAKISKYDPIILTSPGKFIHARQGKLEWIKENLSPQPKDIMFANTGKKFEAIKDKTPEEIRRSMLIDDYYPNLAPWKEIGGIAITYRSYDQVSAILDKFRLKENRLVKEALTQQQIISIAKEFMASDSYNKSHDCKRSTYEFVNWLKKNKGFEPNVLLLAPPKDIKKFPGKSGDGDSHIFAIIDRYGVDFTANQFPGVSDALKITPETEIPSVYKKIGGYYTTAPEWFNGGKTSLKTKWNNLPNWMQKSF